MTRTGWKVSSRVIRHGAECSPSASSTFYPIKSGTFRCDVHVYGRLLKTQKLIIKIFIQPRRWKFLNVCNRKDDSKIFDDGVDRFTGSV